MTLRLIIGNKAYSSWSLRGWLAVRQSGLAFEEVVVPMYTAAWDQALADGSLAPSGGKVPILLDGPVAVWDSLAILDWLADRAGRARFWPEDAAARGMARAMAAEMHAGYPELRRECGMNLRRRFPPSPLSAPVREEVSRIVGLWEVARTRHGGGGPYLFGAFGAADIMFAPVASRFATYSIPIPAGAADYTAAILDHPWVREWIEAARAEPWVIDRYERPDQ